MLKKINPPQIFIEDNNNEEDELDYFNGYDQIVTSPSGLSNSLTTSATFEYDPRADINATTRLKKTFSLFIPKHIRSPLTPIAQNNALFFKSRGPASLISPLSKHSKSFDSFLSLSNPASPIQTQSPSAVVPKHSPRTQSTEFSKPSPHARKGSFVEENNEELCEECTKICMFWGFAPESQTFIQESTLQCLIFLEGLVSKLNTTINNINKDWFAKKKEFKAEAIRISLIEEKRISKLFENLIHKYPALMKYLAEYVTGVEEGWESCFDSTVDILMKLYSCIQYLRFRIRVLKKINGIRSAKKKLFK